jgi:hypothetical protein
MVDTITLSKANPLLPAEDYNTLRKQGFQSIERLSSAIWTDYNNSDPGITVLEAVCYAITDLGYRTGFDIKDILAPENLTDETWQQIFYTARQILHNSPLTLDDYRKLIIDVKGVRNAWLEISHDYEVPIWVDYNTIEIHPVQDCNCKDVSEQICTGRLSVNNVTKDQAEQAKSENGKVLAAKRDELKKQIEQLENTRTELQAQNEKEPNFYLTTKIAEIDHKINKLTTKLQLIEEIISAVGKAVYIPPNILELEGLYNVLVEYEENVIEEKHRETVRQEVLSRLLANRNLCEDFLSVNAIEYEDFGIGASIELEEDADPDVVLANIFFSIYSYFTPSIPFHTIDQMLSKGYQTDDIFDGPALTHGFIDNSELEKTQLFKDIRLSDLIGRITDISGIKGILYLHLPFNGFGKTDSGDAYFKRWVDALQNARKIARIQTSMSQVMFCKNREFISYFLGRPEDRRPERMLKLFKDLKTQERKYKLEGQVCDFPVPVGECMQLEDYFPVTESLPKCYGVSQRFGLPADADAKRQAQALQLKGYLIFFEQILSDYLVQLNHVKELFCFDNSIRQTYFTRVLTELDGLQNLLLDLNNFGEKHFDQVKQAFANSLQQLAESPELFLQRRNRFLDHLLARFSEDISEYEALSRWLTPEGVDERLIGDKINLLKDGEYSIISSGRGKGYDYSQADVWDTDNVSGTERRISRLLGFANASRHRLATDLIVCETVMEIDPKTKISVPKKNLNGRILNVIKLNDPDQQGQVLLTSVEVVDGCCSEQLMMAILTAADNPLNFQFKVDTKRGHRKTAATLGSFWLELWDGSDLNTADLLATSPMFNSQEARDTAFKKLQVVMASIDSNEGLHLLEHILLRPKFDLATDEADHTTVVSFPLICLDACDLQLDQDKDHLPVYHKHIYRIPAAICYDKMPWVLEYIKNESGASLLWQKYPLDGSAPVPLKFRRYEDLTQRVRDLQEFGSERINYEIVSNQDDANPRYSFIIHGNQNAVLAQSPFIFSKKPAKGKAASDDIELEISNLMLYFSFEFYLYCEDNDCDNNEDPFSFRATAVLPCWPKRLRNPGFRNLVEKTIQSESPAHTHIRILWLGILEMQRFENVYADWLTEMAQTEMPSYEIVNPLVDALNSLRSCGCCEDDCEPPSSGNRSG